ncbi:FHA domain protein [Cohaesibacter marisflavi]|uniref:FHA domain protein n=1 Tax=Cohaesibacter marisflavi TaxID=655353 RepID=A0A1I5KIQ6_9HYPH|nr:type VI secretion system-associated FHA domain protein TagH [Cohaesibacter marisflavi]SFO84862.1 FHA domain protein [Cohaesibacter marisflavi]
MGLTLKLMNSGAMPGDKAMVDMVDGTVTIGRGEDNDLSLPDPERALSKRHCVVEERNGDYLIVDISTNGTYLNYGSERIGDIPTPLNNGDVIQLGAYELVVTIGKNQPDANDAMPMPPADASEIIPQAARSGRAPSDIQDSLDDIDAPWDDIISAPIATEQSQPENAPVWKRQAIPDDPFSGDPISEPLDPFEDISVSDDPFAQAPAPEDFSFDAPPLLPIDAGESLKDHSPSSQDHFTRPAVQAPIIPDDWDEMFAPKTEPSPSMAEHDTPAAPMPDAPPVQVSQPTAEAPRQPKRPQGDTGDAARAFLGGAGMKHLDIPPHEMEQTMARMGRVFAAMVSGMREILMTRASIKSELRMERTMVNQGGNNPLKFSISAEQAVEAMIRPTVHGYQDAETATTEALNDIKAHEVAMMSGMDAALKDLLFRLGPDQLSQRIESGSTLGGLLGGRKAKYWEAYEKMYAQIARETEDDFQSAFGREFARAYEEQLKKL